MYDQASISLFYSPKVFEYISLSYIIRRVVWSKINGLLEGCESFPITQLRLKSSFKSTKDTRFPLFATLFGFLLIVFKAVWNVRLRYLTNYLGGLFSIFKQLRDI